MSDKKENIRKWREYIGKHRVIIYFTTQRPYSYIKIALDYHGGHWESEGFSKVCFPDRWDCIYGLNMARKKAIVRMAKAIANIPAPEEEVFQ